MRSGLIHFTIGLVFLSILKGGEPVAATETFQPRTYDAERYRVIWERSPFVVEAPSGPQESSPLSARFVLTGVTMFEGKPLIFVLDRKTLLRISVAEGDSHSGIELISVTQNNDPKIVRADIRVGGEQGSIGYDIAALQGLNNPGTPAQQEVANGSSPAQSAAPLPSGNPSPSPIARKIIRRTTINLAR